MAEPTSTAIALLAAAVLLASSALLSRTSLRVGMPFSLLFLAIGMAAGSEGFGGIGFDDYGLAFRLGTVALVLILFDGGLNTPLASIRAVAWPAGLLATIGVAAVAAVAACGARLVGLPWTHALVLGAVVSSTDAAAVFAVLRGSGIQLRQRVASLLEVESGMNDPMAVILTFSLTELLSGGTPPTWALAAEIVLQIAVGIASGAALGAAFRRLLSAAHLTASGLYAVLTVALALGAFAAPTLLRGSGFLAVYVAGSVLGSGPLPHAGAIRRVHDALAWVSQIGMFLVLGLLVFPSRLFAVAWEGVAIGLFLAFVARPVVVAAFLAPFRLPPREIAFVSWVGLRGAVPIILATFPVLARAPGAERLFDIVFFVVVVNAIVPGWTVRWLARKLGIEEGTAAAPAPVLEITSGQAMSGELLSFLVEPASAAAGSTIADLPFPPGTSVLLLVRGGEIIAPKGGTTLLAGDHVHVYCAPSERPLVQLIFGREEAN